MNDDFKSRFKRFEDWLTNKFWYYNKWYYLLGVFALTVIIIWIYSTAAKVRYDWNVVYAHMGESDPETAQKVKELFIEKAADTNGNGKIEISLYEICHTDEAEEKGENEFFAALYGHDYYLMAVDAEMFELYESLGYFEELDIGGESAKGVYIEALGLYAVVNDAPVLQYTAEQAEERDISEENLITINEDLKTEYEKRKEQAIAIVERISDSQA